MPVANQFDTLKTQRGKQDVSFTAVGYGLQKSFPDAASFQIQASRTRYIGNPRSLFKSTHRALPATSHCCCRTTPIQAARVSVIRVAPTFTGSGPSETNIVGGVTSFGINGNCAGTGGVFRMDRQNVLDFVKGFLP